MLKKIAVLSSVLFLQISYAETCPSISELKLNNLHGWEALNLDDGEPVSPAELKKFIRTVRAFNFAQWVTDAPEGAGQCYYRQPEDTRQVAKEVYFAKNTLAPDNTSYEWHQAGWGYLKCETSVAGCKFLDV